MLFKGNIGELFHESGLIKKQAGQMFESFEKISKETAMACVLAKKAAVEHENIILAGRAGVGKTHLAVSIAIHVMREGKLKRVYSISNNPIIMKNIHNDDTNPTRHCLLFFCCFY